jgi:hypothetical protein
MTVTGALSSPMTMSGKASGFINSPAGIVSAAKASNGGNEKTTAVASAKAAVLWQNSRRVICK